MKTHVMACAVFALAAASCATAKPDYALTPPAPGQDIYRCVESNGHAKFVLVKPDVHQNWQGDHWGPNACEDPANRCRTDDAGLIIVERTMILPSSRARVDMIDIYNFKAGTVLSSLALNGTPVEPVRDACAPHI